MAKVGMIQVIAGLTLLLCGGCSSAGPINSASIRFIQPGVTTRTEVVDNLGSPARVLEAERVLAYEWEEWPPRLRRHRAHHDYPYNRSLPRKDVYHHIAAFCVAFDETWHVTKHKFLDGDDTEDLDEEIANWLKTPGK